MKNKLQIIGISILLCIAWWAIWLWYSYATLPSFSEKALNRKTEIETRQIQIKSIAEFYRQSIKSLSLEHNILQKEKDALDVIIWTGAEKKTLKLGR